jgi:hypothetical protein
MGLHAENCAIHQDEENNASPKAARRGRPVISNPMPISNPGQILATMSIDPEKEKARLEKLGALRADIQRMSPGLKTIPLSIEEKEEMLEMHKQMLSKYDARYKALGAHSWHVFDLRRSHLSMSCIPLPFQSSSLKASLSYMLVVLTQSAIANQGLPRLHGGRYKN